MNPFAAAFLEMSDPEKNRELPREISMRDLVCRDDLGGLPASDVQLALLAAADGRPIGDLLKPEQMRFHFGTERLPSGRPRIMVLRTGVRAAKSLIASVGGLLHGVLYCQFRRPADPEKGERPGADGMIGVRPGEFVRALIVGPKLGLSAAPLEHIRGTMEKSPILRRYLVDEENNKESITVRRPDGALVKIMKVAAGKGGDNLRSTWLAGIVFDEAAFHEDDDAAVNLIDNIDAIRTRLLPGAQAWVVSSPWSEDDSFNKLFLKYFGRPGREIAFHSDTMSMNPMIDMADVEEVRADDPDKCDREYYAIPTSASNKAFFPPDAIEKSVKIDRPLQLPIEVGPTHVAGADWGFRKNSSALAIARAAKVWDSGREVVKAQIVYHDEKRPPKGESLKPSEVVIDFAKRCQEYRARKIQGDYHSIDTVNEELGKLRAADRTFDVVYEPASQTSEDIAERFTEFRRRMQEGLVELPNEPVLLKQLRDTKSKPMPGGKTSIQIPKHGHTHGDVMQAVVQAVVQVDLTVRSAEKKSMTRGRREMNDTGGF